MKDLLRPKAAHLALAVLLCCGLMMPVLGVLLPGTAPLRPLCVAAAVCLVLEAVSLRRVSAIAAAVVLPLGALAWLFAPGHLSRVSDVLLALTLRLRGQSAALPLVAEDAVLLLSLLFGLLSWLVTLRPVSCMPSLLLCVGVMMLLWFSGASHLIPWLLPALAAVLVFVILDRHPQTSPLRLFPLALLLAAAAFLLAPASGVTSEPMKRRADELRQMILDRLFYTEPRDVFSLSSEGYYPQGPSQLGGTPNPSDHPVMQVSTPRTVYLRGVVLNEYDGHVWRNATGSRRNLWSSPRLLSLRDRLFDQSLPAVSSLGSLTGPSDVSVRMLSGSASTLFVPQRIRNLTPGGGLVPYFSNASEVFVTRNLVPGDTWSVSAPLFLVGDPGVAPLVEAVAASPDENWESIRETYTALPSHLSQQVYDLAADIVSGASTPYDRAFAIQSWLSRNCRYTLDVSPHPENVDFVTRFLLDTREGYCTYFASALTVLCRMVGLPARYVEGYLARPDARGEALVTGLDAHAWTEVYFRGFGWLTFDAAPRQRSAGGNENPEGDAATPAPTDEPTPQPTEEPTPNPEAPEENPTPDPEDPDTNATPTPDPENPDPDANPTPDPEHPDADATPTPDPEHPDGETDPTPDPDLPDRRDPNRSFPWWILALLLLLAALTARVLCTRPEYLARRATYDGTKVDIWAQALVDSLAADGFSRRTGETLLNFFRRVDRSSRYAVSLVPAGECLSLLRYSPADPLPSDVETLREAALAVHAGLKLPARAKALLRRVFLPLSRRGSL